MSNDLQLAQVAVALISLTCNISDGTNWNHTYTTQGTVLASNLTCYIDFFNNDPHCTSGLAGTGQTLAHAYGELALATPCCEFTDLEGVIMSRNDCRYYCDRTKHRQQFAYRFNEYNQNDTLQAFPRFTNRTITASSGKCFNYTQRGLPKQIGGGYLRIAFFNATFDSQIDIPAQLFAPGGTTYVYRGLKPPPHAEGQSCGGPRCMYVWGHRSNLGRRHDREVFQCPITISTVFNATNGNQTISDEMARLAAASIALSGRQNAPNDWTQYQLYTFG